MMYFKAYINNKFLKIVIAETKYHAKQIIISEGYKSETIKIK